jgi:hypothetical protein
MSKFKGMHRDNGPAGTPSGFYRRALNALIRKLGTTVSNEDGFDLEYTFAGYVPVVQKAVPGRGILVFLKEAAYFEGPNISHFNEIGWFDKATKTYTKVLKAQFNLAPENTIKVEVDFNDKGEIIVAWNDKQHVPKILNLDSLPFPVDENKIPLVPSQVHLMDMFPASTPPSITQRQLKNITGRVPYGSYSFMFSYEIDKDTETVYTQPDGNFLIGKKYSPFLPINDYVSSQTSSQGIQFEIGNLDQNYRTLKVYAIQDREGVKKAFYLRKIQITGTTAKVLFDGTFIEELPVEELLSVLEIFDRVNAMTTLNGTLMLGGTEKNQKFDYQKYANSIQVRWSIPNTATFDPSTGLEWTQEAVYNLPLHSNAMREGYVNYHGLVRTFAPFSTYQLWIQVVFGNGSTSDPFHLPGMMHLSEAALDVLDPNAATAFIKSIGDPAPQSAYDGILMRHVFDYAAPEVGTDGGYMGYSKNEELYPDTEDFDVWDVNGPTARTLRNKPVRHHKFPGIKVITDKAISLGVLPATVQPVAMTNGATYSHFGRVNLALTLKNIPVPQGLIDAGAVGFRVLYSERQFEDMDVVSYFPVLDYSFRRAMVTVNTPDPGRASTAVVHDYALLLKKPGLNGFTVTEYFNNQAVAPLTSLPTAPSVSGNCVLRYAPANTAVADLDNTGAEEVAYIAQQQPFAGSFRGLLLNGKFLMSDTTRYNSNTYAQPPSFNIITENISDLNFSSWFVGRDVPIASFRQKLNNHFLGLFSARPLIDTGTLIPIPAVPQYIDTSKVFNGDFVRTENMFRFRHITLLNSGGGASSPVRLYPNKKIFPGDPDSINPQAEYPHYLSEFSYPTYARLAAEFRYEDDLKPWDQPNLLVWMGEGAQQFRYSPSFERLNKLKTPIVIDPELAAEDTQPYIIYQSQTRGQLNSVSNWRRFLASDFFIMPRHRGKIVNLQGTDDKLIIHMLRGIYRTRALTTLATSEQEIAVGTGRIFEFSPVELFPMGEGYGGTQHLSSCYAFKLGYFFIDEESGKAFIISDQIKEVSTNGMRAFFLEEFRQHWRDTLSRFDIEYDERLLDAPNHPFGIGYRVAFDERYNRLIVTKKDMRFADDVELLTEWTPTPIEPEPPVEVDPPTEEEPVEPTLPPDDYFEPDEDVE